MVLCIREGRNVDRLFSMATQEDKKLVSCRQDWHQTSSQVVVTLYARTPLPHLSSIKANRTGVRKQGRWGEG